MSLTKVWAVLWGEQTAALPALLPQRQAKYNKYTLEERVKVGGYGTGNSPAKVARHFCQLLDCKLSRGLRCSGYVVFWLKDWITKFKTHQVLKYGVLSKILKFNAHQTFLLHGSRLGEPHTSVSNAEFCLYWSLVSCAITATTCAFCSAPFCLLHQIVTSGHAYSCTCIQCMIVEYMALEYPEWLVFVRREFHPQVGVNRLIAAELPLIGGNSYSVVLITTNHSVSMATPKEEWAITVILHVECTSRHSLQLVLLCQLPVYQLAVLCW